ncbi:vacuolar protein sorting-associated protein 54-like isoform X2 [Schistocerca gregaria]|nr:vacuolar protein sorting-associated protein 54-like isoform X2 [Schistocerca gregaria]
MFVDVPLLSYRPYLEKTLAVYSILQQKKNSLENEGKTQDAVTFGDATRADTLDCKNEVPAVFFEKAFDLSNPQLFYQILYDGTPQTELSDRLARYLSIVELDLMNKLDKRSDAFFQALCNVQSLHSLLLDMFENEKQLEARIDNVENELVTRALSIFGMQTRKKNYIKLIRLLLIIRKIKTEITHIQDLISKKDFLTAIEVFKTSQRAAVELREAACIQECIRQLNSLSEPIAEHLIEEIVQCLCESTDNQLFKDTARWTTILTEILKFKRLDDSLSLYSKKLHQQLYNAFTDTWVDIPEKRCIIRNLESFGKESDFFEILFDSVSKIEFSVFVAKLNKFLFEEIKPMLVLVNDKKQALIELYRSIPSDDTNQKNDTVPQQSESSDAVSDNTTNEDVCSADGVADQFDPLLDSEGLTQFFFENTSDSSGISLHDTYTSKPDGHFEDASLTARERADVENRISYYFNEITSSFIEHTQNWLQEILDIRARDAHTLSTRQFAEYYQAVRLFVEECRRIDSNTSYAVLTSTLAFQHQVFLEDVHKKMKSKLIFCLDSEIWKKADVAPEFCRALEAIYNQDQTLLELAYDTTNDENAACVILGNEVFSVTNTELIFSKTLFDYLAMFEYFPMSVLIIATLICEILAVFNSRVRELLVEEKAVKKSILPSIDITHLALASRCLSIQIVLIPKIRQRVKRYLLQLTQSNQDEVCFEGGGPLHDLDTILDKYLFHRQELYHLIIENMCKNADTRINASTSEKDFSKNLSLLTEETKRAYKDLEDLLPKDALEMIFRQVMMVYNEQIKQYMNKTKSKTVVKEKKLLNTAYYFVQELQCLNIPIWGDELTEHILSMYSRIEQQERNGNLR